MEHKFIMTDGEKMIWAARYTTEMVGPDGDDETYALPPKSETTVEMRFVDGGRGKPLKYDLEED